MTHAASHKNTSTTHPPDNEGLINACALADSVARIARLPTAPRHDWCTSAAHAIAPLAPDAITGFIVAKLNTDRSRLTPESTGVNPDNHPAAINLRTALERIESIPAYFALDQLDSGIVAPLGAAFPDWSRLTDMRPNRGSLAGIFNIADRDHPLIVTAIIDTPVDEPAPDPTHFGAAFSILARQSALTLRSSNHTINWLTEREGLILDQLILGNSVRVIAEQLDRSPHTVHDHVKNLHRKLGATSRGQLIAVALGRTDTKTPEEQGFIPKITRPDPSIAEVKPTQRVTNA